MHNASMKASETSATRLNLSDLDATHKEEDGGDVGLKVVERAASSYPCSSISPHKKVCAASSTDRVLTFLQNARMQNIPVRSGKWNPEEEDYLRKLVELFCLGVLDEVEQKSSMRAWLSRMLNCCPMRISKKQMNGEKFVGKAKFKRNNESIQKMTQEEYDEVCDEVYHLRSNFLKHWAKDEFAKRATRDKAISFEEWYSKVLDIVPRPKIAKNARLVDARRRPQLEALGKLCEQIQAEQKRDRHRVSTSASVNNGVRSYKRPRSEVDDEFPREHVEALDLLYGNASLADPSLGGPAESSFGHGPQDDEDSWILEICSESELSFNKTNGCEVADCTGRSADPARFSIAIEDEFHCSEVLTPQKTAETHFDFGPPSKWSYEEMQDLPSHDSSLWDDSDLLVDGFALLADPGLMLWEDNEYPLDSCGHSVLTPCIPTPHF